MVIVDRSSSAYFTVSTATPVNVIANQAFSKENTHGAEPCCCFHLERRVGPRQLQPQQFLNRWIIPLENQQDYLSLHTGQKFGIPYDQFLIFATNTSPGPSWTSPS